MSENGINRQVILLPGEVEMVFCRIPPGEFVMGSRGYSDREEPLHRVIVSQEYWLGETPVTQEQFGVWAPEHENGFDGKASHPAESMSWIEAMRYCGWLTREVGTQFPGGMRVASLPTEVEWEYACRAGSETEYWNGDGEEALAEVGWFGDRKGSTHAVGENPLNRLCLYDVHGNVFEWCWDRWDEDAYRKRGDPYREGIRLALREAEGGDWEEEVRDTERVLRGGSWYYSGDACRSASRLRDNAWDRHWFWGFRVCLVGSPAAGPEAE